jgi:hypothetical protein
MRRANRFGYIALLWLVVSIGPGVELLAQDNQFPILPGPWNTRVGSQLIYFFEDGNVTGRGTFKSYLAMANASLSKGVWIHFQFYTVTSTGCDELFDFLDYLDPGKRHIIDPANIIGPKYRNSVVGYATNDRYLLTMTPVAIGTQNPNPADLRALSFNWLSGQTWNLDVPRG